MCDVGEVSLDQCCLFETHVNEARCGRRGVNGPRSNLSMKHIQLPTSRCLGMAVRVERYCK